MSQRLILFSPGSIRNVRFPTDPDVVPNVQTIFDLGIVATS
jgi:hypothetical protein